MSSELTGARLRNVLQYSADTGEFTWRVYKGPNARPGWVAGTHDTSGHRQIKIDGTLYLAHRLAWLYVHDKFPEDCLDHANGRKDDNRLANLRPCSRRENMQNLARARNNTSGFTGVVFHKKTGMWNAKIGHKGKKVSLGYFRNSEDANLAYLQAKRTLHEFQPTPREGVQ